jgi:hypothetical protein
MPVFPEIIQSGSIFMLKYGLSNSFRASFLANERSLGRRSMGWRKRRKLDRWGKGRRRREAS